VVLSAVVPLGVAEVLNWVMPDCLQRYFGCSAGRQRSGVGVIGMLLQDGLGHQGHLARSAEPQLMLAGRTLILCCC
jgi:hypothetical protein